MSDANCTNSVTPTKVLRRGSTLLHRFSLVPVTFLPLTGSLTSFTLDSSFTVSCRERFYVVLLKSKSIVEKDTTRWKVIYTTPVNLSFNVLPQPILQVETDPFVTSVVSYLT